MSLSITPTQSVPATPVSPRSPLAAPKGSYSPLNALDDLPAIHHALELFLASKMIESEEFCNSSDPKKERLYMATGYGLIQAVKAMMSFEDKDLLEAINHCRHGNNVAITHRKKAVSLATRFTGLVTGATNTSGPGFIKTMTAIEKHAELVYAETLFEKALLGILYSGDWLSFLKEALNLRTTMNIYRDLGKFIEQADAEAVARGEPQDKSIDEHFRSGVYLGVGTSHLVLSMMPARLLSLVELFGYKGDRAIGLSHLMRAGDWRADRDEPGVSAEAEGARRSVCDMVLLIFHLVLSGFTYDGVDIKIAEKILNWNLQRFPDGVFFLFGQGRLSICRSQPAKAIEYYQRAKEVQDQYRNLHHISHWEMAIANLSLWDVRASLESWKELQAEATWSKAVYTYGMAVCLLQIGDATQKEAAAKLLETVPDLRQRIAGKSIPLEKFVARKARRFKSQGNRLLLPALELANVFLAFSHAPRAVLTGEILPLIEREHATLSAHSADPSKYSGGGYWDDMCLVRFLEGVCLRYIAHPDPDAVLDPAMSNMPPTRKTAEKRSEEAFLYVLANGPKIELEHHLVYNAHYELGRLLACKGNKVEAKKHFELVLSGKPLEINVATKKGKYSLENALVMRTHAAAEGLERGLPL